MARTGVYFSDVKKARDQLVEQGRHPSIDAVRAALGDTGSKTTIHKYLREIDAEEGAQSQSASEAILALAGQLADQLKLEANGAVAAITAEMAALRLAQAAQTAAFEHRLAEAGVAFDDVAVQFLAAQDEIATLTARLHAEEIARHTAEQHARDVDVRLADAERHQASLEEKHRHARDALEHYRSATKEQREQETRRHEQQVQGVQAELRQVQMTLAVRQEELTRVNREAAALANELGANKQVLYLEKESGRKLARKVDYLQAFEARAAVLEAQLNDTRLRVARAEQAAAEGDALCHALREDKAALETALGAARDTSELEARLAKLDRAVFGANDAPDT
ncbi:DNA-binding protein [Massilia sp. S19_KUP03_FR1]|uniref:DNA-binding protein n=1 Tax=Massilia sp. S19_KUP03_FR1 TaxID=3025503 RepID=UPI002FCDBACB